MNYSGGIHIQTENVNVPIRLTRFFVMYFGFRAFTVVDVLRLIHRPPSYDAFPPDATPSLVFYPEWAALALNSQLIQNQGKSIGVQHKEKTQKYWLS